MAFGNVPVDAGNVPIAETYVPGVGFRALQGSTLTNTDGSSNVSSPANFNLTQINSLAVNMAGTDGDTANTMLEVVPGLYNGATVDQQRGNLDNIVAVASAAYTTTQTQADQKNYNHRGIVVVLDVTVPGTGSITLEIDAKDPVSGKYYTVLTGVAVTTLSTTVYRVYPGLTAVANATASDILPRTWRVKVTSNNANTITYSVGCMLIL
jgi:hypothetical protein